MTTIISTLRARMKENPSDETLVQLRIELEDASDWLHDLVHMTPKVREAILNMPSTLINAEPAHTLGYEINTQVGGHHKYCDCKCHTKQG
jgi:hypothetical protein